jgi:hypothetical protein
LAPGRDTATFHRLAEDEQIDVVGHRVTAQPAADQSTDLAVQKSEDWLLVRGTRARTGWLLESFVDLNPPIEVAQYREGRRIRAWFEIHRVEDDGIERRWYLWATIRELAGLPYDFDEIRVFVWNPRADRYETSYRERNLIGFYPLEVGKRETPEGSSPTFRLHLEDEKGDRFERNYYMVGSQVMVQR